MKLNERQRVLGALVRGEKLVICPEPGDRAILLPSVSRVLASAADWLIRQEYVQMAAMFDFGSVYDITPAGRAAYEASRENGDA